MKNEKYEATEGSKEGGKPFKFAPLGATHEQFQTYLMENREEISQECKNTLENVKNLMLKHNFQPCPELLQATSSGDYRSTSSQPQAPSKPPTLGGVMDQKLTKKQQIVQLLQSKAEIDRLIDLKLSSMSEEKKKKEGRPTQIHQSLYMYIVHRIRFQMFRCERVKDGREPEMEKLWTRWLHKQRSSQMQQVWRGWSC